MMKFYLIFIITMMMTGYLSQAANLKSTRWLDGDTEDSTQVESATEASLDDLSSEELAELLR